MTPVLFPTKSGITMKLSLLMPEITQTVHSRTLHSLFKCPFNTHILWNGQRGQWEDIVVWEHMVGVGELKPEEG